MNQYYFYQVFPFLEDLLHDPVRHHLDRKTNVDIFNNSVTFHFYWRPYLNSTKTIEDWADTKNIKSIPYYLLLGDILLKLKFNLILLYICIYCVCFKIGMSAWYMIAQTDYDHRTFEGHLKDLMPILERLGLRMRERGYGKIVWMMQYPHFDTLPVIQSVDHNNVKVYSEKLEHFNLIAMRVLR